MTMKILITGLVLIALVAISTEDESEQSLFNKRYCSNVDLGLWGDYKPQIQCSWRVK